MPRNKKKANNGILLIKKANNLIESRYKFDIWETRFFLSVLSQIRREDDQFHEYRIWYKDVIKNFGLSSGDSYEYLRRAAKSLMQQQFYVNYDKEGITREKAYQIIITADYMKATKGEKGEKTKRVESQEYIDVRIHPEMKPFLLQLQKNFTAYDLKNVVKLGVYPVRIYELMKQYEAIGHRTLEIEELKRMFELKKEYKRYNDFYRFVVEPAVRDINKHTDLRITKVEKIKENRRVVALRFDMENKKKPKTIPGQTTFDFPTPNVSSGGPILIPISEEEAMQLTESDRLFSEYQNVVVGKYGVTPSVFLHLLKTVTEEQLQQAIRVTQRAKANGQIKSTAAGFFVNALKEGFTDEKEEATKRKRKREMEKQYAAALQSLRDERDAAINDTIRDLVAGKPDLTGYAIEALRENPMSGIVIEKKEAELKRALNTDDFRQDKMLREMVKRQIMTIEEKAFSKILKHYETQKSKL